ncbi:hypothetical protein SUGI_0287020 [Cryptomeria japonica]|nr:hypothetical protein SUGI_0287020 [Cryptomeria japonica]
MGVCMDFWVIWFAVEWASLRCVSSGPSSQCSILGGGGVVPVLLWLFWDVVSGGESSLIASSFSCRGFLLVIGDSLLSSHLSWLVDCLCTGLFSSLVHLFSKASVLRSSTMLLSIMWTIGYSIVVEGLVDELSVFFGYYVLFGGSTLSPFGISSVVFGIFSFGLCSLASVEGCLYIVPVEVFPMFLLTPALSKVVWYGNLSCDPIEVDY